MRADEASENDAGAEFQINGVSCRGARAMLGISQSELCADAECSRKLLNDFENGIRRPHLRNVERIRAALEAAGASFLIDGERVGVMVDASRASSRTARGRTMAERTEG